MTFNNIKRYFYPASEYTWGGEDEQVKLILETIPYIRFEGMHLAMNHYEWSKDIPKPYIRKYVLDCHEYNSVEVSQLVSALKNLCKKVEKISNL
jgi:hypothetical protein